MFNIIKFSLKFLTINQAKTYIKIAHLYLFDLHVWASFGVLHFHGIPGELGNP